MIVYVEGFRCSGKSTLIERFADPTSVKIGRALDKDGTVHAPDCFMRHDEDKCARARRQPADRLVLVDRGYISTVLFYTVKQELYPEYSAWSVYDWLLRGLGRSLWRPDHYIFLETPLDVCLARARQMRSPNPHDMWLMAPVRMREWYDRLLAAFEAGTPLHVVDGLGTQEEVQTRFTTLLTQLVA